jgi:hypothetical protein
LLRLGFWHAVAEWLHADAKRSGKHRNGAPGIPSAPEAGAIGPANGPVSMPERSRRRAADDATLIEETGTLYRSFR